MDESARTAPAALEIAERLDRLARQELDEVERFIGSVPPIECAVLLIEACRCLDHMHVVQMLSAKEEGKLSVHDFDIIVRGWNMLFGLMQRKGEGEFNGVPLRESVPELRQALMGMLHFAGRYVLLNRTAEMVRHGMVAATTIGDEIELKLSDRTLSDHFHDQVDHGKFAELNAKALSGYKAIATDASTMQHLRDVMGKLTFPWRTPQGVMVGYSADPEIDAYFLDAVTQNTLQWRDDAGIHPRAELGGCSGGLLTTVVHLLMSFHTKHIMFVEEAIKLHPGINQHMSLTIWKTRSDLITSLVTATAASEEEVSVALDLITVRADDAAYFLTEQAPGIPLVIELCNGYLLTPVSGVFRNPFNAIRMLRESTSVAIRNAFREHREEWMAEDLYALFEGPRFQRVPSQTKLRRDGQVVTDIDAAIFDNATGELVLFQLKWQDFTSSSVRTQRSKAKNFSDQVQGWAGKVVPWINQFGVAGLCRALKIKPSDSTEPRVVRLIAIGRSNARFRSYGYNTAGNMLVLPWPQFARLRLVIGPGLDFFELLTQAVISENAVPVERKPLPYVLERHGLRVTFRDIWSGFESDDGDAGATAVGQLR
ncbi:hypothetical protein GOZ80_08070 [Agrobacterium vitis]|uniref:Uncharacterized protein n=1 Tax=Agrobacterium vitis TaxID=373 RepID=A0ABD6GAL7_AGRVI|nr:hypothetical protein [Agrobacterium vitis]MUO79746.1 hypothetical protein [Agrobacterium vitis]MUO93765.1 hypothetical protein [Agrobacterium vitis]MUP03984.1 hypothetical protein [Agrobacterium vitis]MVA91977.1 hypothetical protein [Agrobacterium vitis]MVB01454.1 hypothetical protein [Agrobacterium vitis]